MADRKAELERKKAKLQALREEKLRRQKEREQQELESSHRVIRGDVDQKVNIDDLLTSVGVKPVSDVLLSYSSLPPSAQEMSSQSTPDSSLQSAQSPMLSRKTRKKPQLCVVSVQTTDIPPKEVVKYAKHTQTAASPERGGNVCFFWFSFHPLFWVFFPLDNFTFCLFSV